MDAINAQIMHIFGTEIGKDPNTGLQTVLDSSGKKHILDTFVTQFLKGFNYTLSLCDIDECISKLSNGKKDVIIGEHPFYFIPDNETIIPIQSTSQDAFYIISPYNCSIEKAIEDSTVSDFAHTTRSYTGVVWILILIAISTLSILVRIHAIVNRKKKISGIWTLTSFLLLNPNYKILNWNSKFISVLIAIFTFLIMILYTKNMITTEQTRMKEQKVYKSYRDIISGIDNGVGIKIMHSSLTNLLSELNNEPRTDVRMKMKKYLENGNGRLEQQFMNFIPFLASGESNNLVIETKLYSQSLKYYACSHAVIISEPKNPDICLYRTPEVVDSEQPMLGIMASKEFLKKNIYFKFILRSRRSFEFGLRFETLILNWEQTRRPLSRSALDCLSESRNLKSYDPEHRDIGMKFFIKTFLFILIIPIYSIVFLHREKHRKNRRILRRNVRKVRKLRERHLKYINMLNISIACGKNIEI